MKMVQLTFHQKLITFQCCLLSIAFVFQLLAVLSVPVTNSISLCTYQGYKFGVFGLCDANVCSDIRIGYKPSELTNLSGFSLPSNARHSISYLLVVHPVATGLTFAQLVMTTMLFNEHFSSSSKYFLVVLFWTLPTFLLTLLSFLVDILLFIPHLDWCGWLMLASTVLIALCGTTMCIMRRAVTSRREYVTPGKTSDLYLAALSYDEYEEDDLSSFNTSAGNKLLRSEGSSDNLSETSVLHNSQPSIRIRPQRNFSRRSSQRSPIIDTSSLNEHSDINITASLESPNRTMNSGPNGNAIYNPKRVVSYPVVSMFTSEHDDDSGSEDDSLYQPSHIEGDSATRIRNR